MENTLVGREKEQLVLQKALESNAAEMISVIGRRRIGKTFLIKTAYKDHLKFVLTGTQNAPEAEQLLNFAYALQLSSPNNLLLQTPKSWMEAFFVLIQYLKSLPTDKKHVIFLDEVPWLSTHKSGFLRALSFFWNSWAVNENIVVVICGSAASWMIQKIVNDKGGLHNRITRRIILHPFSLKESKAYLLTRNIKLNHYHLVQIYMAMGGIPHYLKEIEAGKSATQNIEDICFSETGLLHDEFSNLYSALFEKSENHIAVVRALANKKKGMLRKDIISEAKIANGGSTTKVLKELEQSGFIKQYYPFGKKNRDSIYRLTDEYSNFYLQFIEKHKNERSNVWHNLSQTQAYKIWCGYAFENVCLTHLSEIKQALSIAGIYSVASSFYKKGTKTEKGAEIDLILDRNDAVINLFEIKFHDKPFVISKEYAKMLLQKQHVFEESTKTKKHIFIVLIAAFGLIPNEHSLGLVSQTLTLDDLF